MSYWCRYAEMSLAQQTQPKLSAPIAQAKAHTAQPLTPRPPNAVGSPTNLGGVVLP